MSNIQLHLGDCVEVMKTLPNASINCVITDPPYPEIDRVYGRITESEWRQLMMDVCVEVRRLLKPTGSAVFILQPNSRKVGNMRGWLFEFQAWVCREWNMVQDVYWWNTTAMPTKHVDRRVGLMRPSVKPMVWAGDANCYRNQEAILWEETQRNAAMRTRERVLRYKPSGHHTNSPRMGDVALERGGVTPMNFVPFSHADPVYSAGANGHSAGTPMELAKWWTRYICPSGGTVLDPFNGSATMMLAALEYGCHGIGIDKMPEYHELAKRRVADAECRVYS